MKFVDLKAQQNRIRKVIDANLAKVLDHGQYILGPEVAELEQKLADFCGAKHCVTVASGTEALLISLMSLGIKPGDEVITTPFTFVATAEVIVLLGAVPVFVDIDSKTYNLNPEKIEGAISNKTKAIIPISMYGQVSDMDSVNRIAAKHGIPVIEDAAQSFGGTYKGRYSCNLSEIACTSFFPSKPLGCYGDGGAIFTDDDSLAKAMTEIRVHGQSARYCHTRIGVGGRMDTLQCAIVLAKLEVFNDELRLRQTVAENYTQRLEGVAQVKCPTVVDGVSSAWAQYTVLVEDRKALQDSFKKENIPTAIHYPKPLHLQPAYLDICRLGSELTVSEDASNRVLSLPMHPYLDVADQEKITSVIRGHYK